MAHDDKSLPTPKERSAASGLASAFADSDNSLASHLSNGTVQKTPDLASVWDLARRLRADSVRMVSHARTSHLASCLSVADIMAVLYGAVLRLDPAMPSWDERDRLIMSKGHAAAILYAALANTGFFPPERLLEFGQDGSYLAGHVSHSGVPGVEVSTGSLGHGLPIGTGMALAARSDGSPARTFVVMSDGELDEGSNWEAVLFAGHHELDNLITIIDFNKIQSLDLVERTLRLEPLAAKFRSFGWCAVEVDGHDIAKLWQSLQAVPRITGRPTAVVAHTTKGKGVSFMEDSVDWHYRTPADDELSEALRQLEGKR